MCVTSVCVTFRCVIYVVVTSLSCVTSPCFTYVVSSLFHLSLCHTSVRGGEEGLEGGGRQVVNRFRTPWFELSGSLPSSTPLHTRRCATREASTQLEPGATRRLPLSSNLTPPAQEEALVGGFRGGGLTLMCVTSVCVTFRCVTSDVVTSLGVTPLCEGASMVTSRVSIPTKVSLSGWVGGTKT